MCRLTGTLLLLFLVKLSLIISGVTGIYTHADFTKAIRAKSDTPQVQPADEYSVQMENAALMEIPKCLRCLNIAIVGAGVAGLTTALELSLSGHNVTIYEASNRTGGRILTYRHPTGGYMTELGAMRLPLDVHTLLQTYIQQRFNLPVVPFRNQDNNTWVFLNNIQATTSQANRNPSGFNFQVHDNEQDKTPDTLWNAAVEPLLQFLADEGPEKFANQYGSYSIDQYLDSINMSRGAIDYINLMFDIETNLLSAIPESIYDMNIRRSGTNYYHIRDGNDRLSDSLRDACLAIPNAGCSIIYNAVVTDVVYYDSDTPSNVQLTWLNSSSQAITGPRYDSVVIATTATAANIINFKERGQFIEKYRAFRQVHYDCATKVALFFNLTWWYSADTIRGGRSTTDMPIHAVYYHNFNESALLTDGAAILASYTWAQDALLWQSLSSDTAMRLALANINLLHKETHVSDSFVDGITKDWCDDEYAHGAFILFTPLQERNIKEALRKSVADKIFFVGEHTSSAHGWVEGAIASGLRGVMTIQEEPFDLVIVGGGPIGLLTAIRLASKNPNMTIAIMEQFQIGNQNGSSHEDVKQFRQPHSEVYLAELAQMSIPLWRDLEQKANLPMGSILNLTNGFLIIGDPVANLTTVEGNFNGIQQNCIELDMGCEFLNSVDIQNRYRLFHVPANYNGIFHSESGYINVTQLMIALVKIIQTDYQENIIIREQEEFLELDQSILDIPGAEVRLFTNRGSLRAKQIVYVPGPYAKNVSNLHGFDLQMTMWELPDLYFALRSSDVPPTPTWFAVGSNIQSHFHGYSTESSGKPGYVKISPEFIRNMDSPLIYPKDRQGPTNTLVQYFIEQAQQWINMNAPLLNPNNYTFGAQTCLATFVPDNGFIIDYLPTDVKYHDKLMMYASGWGMKFAPVFADILVNLILNTIPTSPYAKYMPEFSIQNRVVPSSSTTSPISTTATPEKSGSSYVTPIIVLSVVLTVVILSIIVWGVRRSIPPPASQRLLTEPVIPRN